MENLIAITDVFKHAVENLHTYTPYERAIISKNIADLDYLDELLKRSKKTFQILINETATAINNRTIPPDIFSISAILYKGKKAGLDGSLLHKAMHENGEWLMKEELKNIKEAQNKKFLN